jgi:chorismate synthase
LSGNSIGRRLILTSFGESHGKCIGTVLDGCPAGLELEEKDIQKMLDLRKPGQSLVSTQRKEGDVVEILTGTFRGYTTGAPITMIIWNKDQKSIAYEKLRTEMRPGHSDYPAYIKYKKFNDHRGGGRFSGRLTATHVMGGAIARKLLKVTLGIETNSFVSQIGKVKMDREFNDKMVNSIYKNEVRCPEVKTAKIMRENILNILTLKIHINFIVNGKPFKTIAVNIFGFSYYFLCFDFILSKYHFKITRYREK